MGRQLQLPYRQGSISIGSLFSGIGGLEWGLEEAIEAAGRPAGTVFQVEINPYSSAVLARHWPTVLRFGDVCRISSRTTGIAPVSMLLAGSPCQDISVAAGLWGREGFRGRRSGLWSEADRLVGELEPDIFIWENVGGALGPIKDKKTKKIVSPAPIAIVLSDLHARGYDAWFTTALAASVGAQHLRLRVFVVAFRRDGVHIPAMRTSVLHRCDTRLDLTGSVWPAGPGHRPRKGEPQRQLLVHKGVVRFHKERIECDGNAVVPQCGFAVGSAAVSIYDWMSGNRAALTGLSRPREAYPLTPQGLASALTTEALGLITGALPSREFVRIPSDQDWILCGERDRASSPLCRSFPGRGTMRSGIIMVPSGAPTPEEVEACRFEQCSELDPVDPSSLRLWPTATARDWRSGKSSAETRSRNSRPLNEVAAPNGYLNPDWVDGHMGFGAGFTYVADPGFSEGRRGKPPKTSSK